MKSVFELSKKGRKANQIPALTVEEYAFDNGLLSEMAIELPELDAVTLSKRLEQTKQCMNRESDVFDECAREFNGEIGDWASTLSGFEKIHPLQKKRDMQGSVEVIYRVQEFVKAYSGATCVSLLPQSREQAEFAMLKMVKKYFKLKGEENRINIVLPSNDDIINTEIAKNLGFEVQFVPVNDGGFIHFEALKGLVGDSTALVVINLSDALCKIEESASAIADLCKDCGALCMVDARHLKALRGILRGIDLGYDFMIENLCDYTFAPSFGGENVFAICAGERVFDLLPAPMVTRDKSGSFSLSVPERSIGQIRAYYGNFNALLRAYCHLSVLGRDGMRGASEMAVLNANYLMKLLEKHNLVKQTCLDRFMFKAKNEKCTSERLKSGVIIRVASTHSKEDLEDFATRIIALCEK